MCVRKNCRSGHPLLKLFFYFQRSEKSYREKSSFFNILPFFTQIIRFTNYYFYTNWAIELYCHRFPKLLIDMSFGDVVNFQNGFHTSNFPGLRIDHWLYWLFKYFEQFFGFIVSWVMVFNLWLFNWILNYWYRWWYHHDINVSLKKHWAMRSVRCSYVNTGKSLLLYTKMDMSLLMFDYLLLFLKILPLSATVRNTINIGQPMNLMIVVI